ncbi:hypothetical protein LZS85_15565 [Aliivibrio fischeri]|uniref:hypothetical protein n=1 Tax=Aliivibrio fischeri TaxID=668 RepID=UPI001F1B48B5|nr:hypothetical protein [Aliivibrio fischeri]MCE7567541.1 hypothetical protein [Aliivibrio fischeri]
MAKVVKQAASYKTPLYNGTHGNLSVQCGEVKSFFGAVGDVYELFELGVGVRLIEAKVSIPAALSGGKVQLQLVKSEDGSKVADITGEIDLAATGITTSDDNGYFPNLPDLQEELIVQAVISGATVTSGKAIQYQIYTQSVGNA